MRNYPLGIFGNIRSPADCGFLFQNLLYLILTPGLPMGSSRVHFWRTKDKAEVDFVVEKAKALIPIEAMYKALKDIEISMALLSFCGQYRPAEAYVVNLSLRKRTRAGNTSVYAVPYWDLLHKFSG